MSTEKTLLEYNKDHISLTVNSEDELTYCRLHIHDLDKNYFVTAVEFVELLDILKENSSEIVQCLKDNLKCSN